MVRHVIVSVLLVCALAARPTDADAACTGTAATAGPVSIEVAGVRRTFVVRPPSADDGKTAAPVVLAFHPFGMNAQYMMARVPVGRAWREALAVYPEGLSRGGGDLAPGWQGRPGDLDDRDLKFFDAMLAWLDEHACIDRSRVFVLGYSNGAGLAHLIACERSDRIAGAAIASGRLGCTPAAAKPLALSHGLADRTIPYAMAVEASRAWSTQNGCKAPPRAGAPGCFVAAGCAAPVTLCTYEGGHEYHLPFTAAAMEMFKNVGR